MSVQDFIRTVAPPPDWLEKAWTGARRRGIDTLTPTTSTSRLACTGTTLWRPHLMS